MTVLVRQIEADILTISRNNFILVLSCSFKVSLVAFKFLVGSCQHVFPRYYYKTVLLSKKVIFQVQFKKNDLHQQDRKKLNIRHLNGHLDFSTGFHALIPQLKLRKNAKIAQKTWALV